MDMIRSHLILIYRRDVGGFCVAGDVTWRWRTTCISGKVNSKEEEVNFKFIYSYRKLQQKILRKIGSLTASPATLLFYRLDSSFLPNAKSEILQTYFKQSPCALCLWVNEDTNMTASCALPLLLSLFCSNSALRSEVRDPVGCVCGVSVRSYLEAQHEWQALSVLLSVCACVLSSTVFSVSYIVLSHKQVTHCLLHLYISHCEDDSGPDSSSPVVTILNASATAVPPVWDAKSWKARSGERSKQSM